MKDFKYIVEKNYHSDCSQGFNVRYISKKGEQETFELGELIIDMSTLGKDDIKITFNDSKYKEILIKINKDKVELIDKSSREYMLEDGKLRKSERFKLEELCKIKIKHCSVYGYYDYNVEVYSA